VVNDPPNFLAAQRLTQDIRHDELGPMVPPERDGIGVLLAAVRQHLPIVVEGDYTTGSLSEWAHPFGLEDISYPHT
jgi:hypothetical protein